MKTRYLILLFLQLLLLQLKCCCGQQQTTTATATATTSSSFTNTVTSTNNERTPLSTTSSTTSMYNATLTTNTTSGTQTTFYSPSPTSFVYTHFPLFPLHTGSSSSAMSSARPSQSAPYPDDTIGKYGRLHISQASSRRHPYTPLSTWLAVALWCFFLLHFA